MVIQTEAFSFSQQAYSLPRAAAAGRSEAYSGSTTGGVASSRESEPAAVFETSPEAEQRLKAEGTAKTENGSPSQDDLSPEDEEKVDQLKQRDNEVRQHEQAHLAAAGPYALGGPSYEYTSGPDGRRYASGGEVQIDTSPISDDPEATLAKAKVVKRAALAPADPSGQDYRVAAQADRMAAEARQELAAQAAEAVRAYGQAGQNPQASPHSTTLNLVI